MDHPDLPSIYELFERTVSTYPDRVAYRYKQQDAWRDISWPEMRELVRSVSKSLLALGVRKGQAVNILGQTRLEWVACDFGTTCCGAVTVGIYASNLAEDCAYIVNHCDAELIFVDGRDQLEKIQSVRAEMPRLRQIVIWDGESDPARDVLSWNDFIERGREVADRLVDEAGRAIRPDDLASLVYTSGTTGLPKGAMISHGNLVFVSWTAGQMLYVEPQFVTLLFLPLAHVFARLIVYVNMRAGSTIAFAEDLTKVVENMREIRPHSVPSAPRIYEKIHERVIVGVREAGGLKQKLFEWALGVGREVSRRQQHKQPLPAWLRLRHRLADRLVLHKVRDVFGGRLVYAISGAAPLNKEIAEWFHACGVLILEGIGMTENTSFTNVNPIDANKFGTVGPAGPGIECRIAEDGEVLYRGPNVMLGYYKSPEATAETIDAEGWLHTGDIGTLDEDGYLTITDRKKDIIVTSGGKNVAPQRIERMLRACPYLSQVVVVGDKRKFISALVTLNADTVGKWASAQGITVSAPEQLAREPKVLELIGREIERCNHELASYETVKKFRVLPHDLSIEGGELTPSMKVKRKVVVDKHVALVEEMYRG